MSRGWHSLIAKRVGEARVNDFFDELDVDRNNYGKLSFTLFSFKYIVAATHADFIGYLITYKNGSIGGLCAMPIYYPPR